MLCFILSVLLASFVHLPVLHAAPEESPEKAAAKLMTAWWECDFDTIRNDCNPRHPFRKSGNSIQTLIENITYTRKWIGTLKKLEVKQVIVRKNRFKTVIFQMFFTGGVYEGVIHLTSDNRFTGYGGPYLEKGADLPELNEEQMREDFDFMVTVLRDAMPHDIAIREAFGIDVWKKLAEYRSRITGEESLPLFARLIRQALNACKGHHLSLFAPDWNPEDKWYRQCFAETVPPETLKISRNIHALLNFLPPDHRPSPIDFLYWGGEYYTAPEFSIDGKTYHGPLKLIAVDGRRPEEVEKLICDRLRQFDRKNRRFFQSDFYAFLPSFLPDRRTFRFETPEKKSLSLTILDNAEVAEKQGGMFYAIPKQVLFLKEHSLVYLRVPSMDPEDLPFYEKHLRMLLEKEKPRYAVIDIRGNGGGSDSVPESLLRTLSANPVFFKGILATPANERIRRYMKLRGKDFSNNANVRNIPWLDNRKFDVQEFNLELKGEKNAPCEHIYVIAHDIYSAAGTLVAIAKANPHITALGFPGTRILGMGIDPYCFSLPNSKLTISVEPAIDLTNCKSASDSLHLDVEVELPLSPEAYLAYLYHPVSADYRDYLENEDPFMRNIFTMIRKRETTPDRQKK